MGYIVGKELNKYFTEKYGKNFERAKRRYEIEKNNKKNS